MVFFSCYFTCEIAAMTYMLYRPNKLFIEEMSVTKYHQFRPNHSRQGVHTYIRKKRSCQV